MANAQKKNVIYVDTTGTITVGVLFRATLFGILITPSAESSRVVIKESVSGTVVLDVKVVPLESRYLDFTSFKGIELTGSFEIATLTNITSVQLYGSWNIPLGETK